MPTKAPIVAFILTSRFPTEKAYGVTTEYSARAIFNLFYDVVIITPFKDRHFESKINVLEIQGGISSKLLSSKTKRFIFCRYHLFLVLYSLTIKSHFSKRYVVFWTRDIFLTYMLSLFTKNIIILELHNLPKGIQNYFIKYLIKKNRVYIAPITDFLSSKFNFNKSRYILAPMAVNNDEFIEQSEMKLKNNTIIYVGTTSSGGVELDCNFINNLAFLVAANFPEWVIELVGINKDFFIDQISSSISTNINFLGYIQRDEALKKMKYAKVGLVLYGNNDYHQFPIKIVEYAASGLSILASDTPIHRRVLGSDKCVFYEVQSPISAFASFKSLLDNPNMASELNFNLSNWVKKLTYTNRVTKVLELVLKESRFN